MLIRKKAIQFSSEKTVLKNVKESSLKTKWQRIQTTLLRSYTRKRLLKRGHNFETESDSC